MSRASRRDEPRARRAGQRHSRRGKARAKDSAGSFPTTLASEAELVDYLTCPRPKLVEFIKTIPGRLVVLGAGGKMGPTLAVLAARAAERAGHELEVTAVSRFGDDTSRAWLEDRGVTTLKADLLRPDVVGQLPDADHVVYLVGLKFGTQENPSLTWAVNTLVPAYVMERYATARIVALSTGNVYPMVSVRSRGAEESNPLTPLGEYPNAAVARERLFDYFSRKNGTKVALLRLNYAVELRYGVLADIAAKVFARQSIELANGYFNCIWQGDANEMILRSFPLGASPARPWNLTAPAKLRVREVASRFGTLFGVQPRFIGTEQPTALLSDSSPICEALGEPATPLEVVMKWTADWVKRGGRSLNKATHFEVRDGQY